MKIRYPNTIMVLTSFVFFNLWVWEFSVKRWQLICLKTLLRFAFISCFKSTIFAIVRLLNTYQSFLWRDNLKILLEDLNNQKKILKDNGIGVDDNITKYNLLVGVYSWAKCWGYVHHALPVKKLKDSFSDLTTARNLILKRVTFCQSRIDVSKCSISYNYITYMYSLSMLMTWRPIWT